MLRKFIHCVLLAATLVFPLCADIDYQIEDQPQVIEKAFQFEQKGILKQKDNGYLYLEVSRDFIAEVLPLIEAAGKITPPHHFTSKKGIGAHVSVMYENEQILNDIWEIKELGEEFCFTVVDLRTVKLNKNNKAKKLWLLAVVSPELEKLRENYGLSPLLKGHDFHITLGYQTPGKVHHKIEGWILEEETDIEDDREAA